MCHKYQYHLASICTEIHKHHSVETPLRLALAPIKLLHSTKLRESRNSPESSVGTPQTYVRICVCRSKSGSCESLVMALYIWCFTSHLASMPPATCCGFHQSRARTRKVDHLANQIVDHPVVEKLGRISFVTQVQDGSCPFPGPTVGQHLRCMQ